MLAVHHKLHGWTCTNGHCSTRPKTITLEIDFYGQLFGYGDSVLRFPSEPRAAMSLSTRRGYDKTSAITLDLISKHERQSNPS
jgi:hypothetical protein